MSINIGDNFSYLGKKFLDARESFDTLENMHLCTDVPVGFITYCVEDKKRYEYTENGWIKYSVNSGNVDLSDYTGTIFGDETPENDEVIWFSEGASSSSNEVTYDNPIINELFSCIQILQKQIVELQKDVEYLKIYGGGNGSNDDNNSEDDNNNNNNNNNEGKFLLEDGGRILLEDGGYLLLDGNSGNSGNNNNEGKVLLEDGGRILLERGGYLLLDGNQ